MLPSYAEVRLTLQLLIWKEANYEAENLVGR